jgi:hypothetical protein
MSKPRPITYVVQTSKTPFAGKAFRVVGYNKEGIRKQYWFATREDAEKDARDRNFQLATHGSSLEMTTLDRADAWNAQAVLAPFKVSLLEAATHYATFARAKSMSKPLDAFAREYKAEMQGRVDSGSLKPGALKAAKETFVKITDWVAEMEENERLHPGFHERMYEYLMAKYPGPGIDADEFFGSKGSE